MEIKKGSRYPTYPVYKDSGVEWLGEVPEHWEVKRVKYISRFIYGDSLAENNRESGDVPVYGSNGQVGTHNTANTKGPCLVIGRKGSFGKITYSDAPCFAIDTTFLIDASTTKANIRWLYYALSCLKLDDLSRDSAVPGLNREIAHNQFLQSLALAEQLTIATFLDRETTKIDTLIAKKQRLIELLQEKRTALINQAVTRGRDPDAMMKDSGVAWLGDVPEQWEVKRLKDIAYIDLEKLPENTIPDYDLLYVDISNVDSSGNINNLQEYIFEEAPSRARKKVKSGDTILSTVRTYLKAIAFIDKPPENLVVSTGFAVLHPKHGISPKYLWKLVQSQGFVDAVVANSEGVSYPAITPSKLACLPVWVSSIDEQCTIADFLDRETAKIDNLISKVQAAIQSLQEYRTALISAAVTGKIDVTNKKVIEQE